MELHPIQGCQIAISKKGSIEFATSILAGIMVELERQTRKIERVNIASHLACQEGYAHSFHHGTEVGRHTFYSMKR